MATTTQNLGLIKPAGTDKIRIAQINSNMDTLDAKIGPVGSTSLQEQINNKQGALTFDNLPTSGSDNPVKSGGVYTEAGNLAAGMAILANNNTHAAIASGQYVYVRGHSTLAEGLYTANAAIAANGTLSTSNLTAVSGGGLNGLLEQIANSEDFDAQIYDNDTSTGVSFTNAYYTKIGGLVFMRGRGIASSITLSSMFQIRNLPCYRVWAGGLYLPGISGNGGDRTIQTSTTGAFFRPNITGTVNANSNATFWLIGSDY